MPDPDTSAGKSPHETVGGESEREPSSQTIHVDGSSQTVDHEQTVTVTRKPQEVCSNFGDYDLLDEIARGGMGVVYRAKHRRLDRVVALKMILAGRFSEQQGIERFQAEAKAAAGLDHPNIVPIYEIGEHDGRPYFSMGLVEGNSLAQELINGPLPSHRAAEMLRSIASAVHYAHEQGIIHRDLKPANVLLDAQKRPRITDFGLAKSLTGDSGLTATGQVMGTPSYMPPEQAAGLTERIGARSDVYALGAILYATLTGRPPFQSAQVVETLRQVQDNEPLRPRQLNPDVDRDLETICLKCLEKIPQRRYASAKELEEDLERYLAGQPIQARPASRLERAVKWVKRRPTIAALSGVTMLAFVLLGMLLVGWVYQQQLAEESEEAGRQRDAAEGARKEAERQEALARSANTKLKQQTVELSKAQREADRQRNIAELERGRVQQALYASAINLADRAWRENRVGRMMKILRQQIPGNDRPDLRGYEWYYLHRLPQGHVRTAFYHASSAVRSLSISKQTGLAVSIGNEIKVWSLKTGKEESTLPNRLIGGTFVNAVAISADGKSLALGQTDGRFTVWDRINNRALFSVECAKKLPGVVEVAISPDGKTFLSGGARVGELFLWDARGNKIRKFDGHAGGVAGVEFSPDGKQLATGGSDKTIRIWNVATGKTVRMLTGFDNYVQGLCWSEDGKQIAGASYGGDVRVFEAATGKQLHLFRGHRGSAQGVAFHPTFPILASNGADGTVRLWNLHNGREQQVIKGHESYVANVAWSPIDKLLLTVGSGGAVRVWNPGTSSESKVFTGHTNVAKCVKFRPDGKMFATAGWDGLVILRETETGKIVRKLRAPSDTLFTVAFDPAGKRVAAAGSGGVIHIWEVATGIKLYTLRGHGSYVSDIEYTKDGNRLVSASYDKSLRIWSFPAGTTERTLNGHDNMVYAMALDPKRPVIASGGHDYKMILWDMNTWKQITSVKSYNFPNGMIYSPDGKWLAVPTGPFGSSTVGLYDSKTARLLHNRAGHENSVGAIGFTPDSKRMITGSWDKTVKIWDISTGRETLTLPAGDDVHAIAVSPDGRTIVAACAKTTVMWYAPVPVRTARN